MDANSGEPWSEMDIADLAHSIRYGNTIADAASMRPLGSGTVCSGAGALYLRLGRLLQLRPLKPLIPARPELGLRGFGS
jgi:hypothetical protein